MEDSREAIQPGNKKSGKKTRRKHQGVTEEAGCSLNPERPELHNDQTTNKPDKKLEAGSSISQKQQTGNNPIQKEQSSKSLEQKDQLKKTRVQTDDPEKIGGTNPARNNVLETEEHGNRLEQKERTKKNKVQKPQGKDQTRNKEHTENSLLQKEQTKECQNHEDSLRKNLSRKEKKKKKEQKDIDQTKKHQEHDHQLQKNDIQADGTQDKQVQTKQQGHVKPNQKQTQKTQAQNEAVQKDVLENNQPEDQAPENQPRKRRKRKNRHKAQVQTEEDQSEIPSGQLGINEAEEHSSTMDTAGDDFTKSGKKTSKHKHHVGSGEKKSDVTPEEPEVQEEDVPYSIENSDIMGRYLVASRDIKQGEVILTADPLVVGPPQGCQPMCLGCYKKLHVDNRYYRCEQCGWPMCGEKCPGRGKQYGHSEEECTLYSSARSKLLTADMTPLYLVVVPLRCLLLRDHHPDEYAALLTMEAHNHIRRELPTLWQSNQENVVNRIRKFLGFEFDEELIHTICGILEVNAFEVGQNDVSIRALYPRAFYMAHDCVPNTGHTDDKDFGLRVRATTLIPKGSSINLSYAYTLQGTMKRREHLKESKFFDCTCARCSDPTELGTYAGALKCPKCGNGAVLSTAPLDSSAEWRCSNPACRDYSVPGDSVRQLLERVGDEVEALDENSVVALEGFLTRYQNVLHPNHYHCLGVLHSLAQLYGKAPGYIINDMTEQQLIRKRDICRQLLQVVDVLEPGYSRLRGVLLYELHAPLMILTTRGVEARTLNYRDLRSSLKEVAACLEEASVILGFEPESSHEGIMGNAAKEALRRVKEWQRIITNG